jgi:catechol 2,3-dioxygenase-like lactoylglutathione lyase family enzyme
MRLGAAILARSELSPFAQTLRPTTMIDHVSVPVRDLAAGVAFYTRVLAPLGYAKLVERPGTAGFGKGYPEFWLNLRAGMAAAPADPGVHVALRAPSREAVQAFHAAALEAGGASDGEPRPRQAAVTGYFGAFIRDPDGNKVEAVTFPRTKSHAVRTFAVRYGARR